MKKKTQMMGKWLLTAMIALTVPQVNAADFAASNSTMEQEREIQVEGRVVDAHGVPLLGVNIQILRLSHSRGRGTRAYFAQCTNEGLPRGTL